MLIFTVSTLLLLSCNKEDLYVDATYPDQKIGISQAAVATLGPGANGVYTVTPKLVGRDFKYIVDATGGKFNVPMGVIRSGINLNGVIDVNLLVASADTINVLKASGLIIPTITELLPTSAYTLPTSVRIEDGKPTGDFTLSVNLSFLVANITKKYAIPVALSSSKIGLVNPNLSLAVVYIDPALVLLPTANFATVVDVATKTVEFLNSSLNGVTYSWNYGDATPVVNTIFPKHIYANSGTYAVTLTVTGVTGAPSVRTRNVFVP